jgi:hypothetical protein
MHLAMIAVSTAAFALLYLFVRACAGLAEEKP